MNIDGWRYYNHAAVPDVAPHEIPNLKPINDGTIWKLDGRPLLARWTEDYDCKIETQWWYCVLDKPFDISELKSSRRYKINKGNKLFDVRIIEPMDYVEALMKVQIAAFSAYPEKYRPKVNEDDFYNYLEEHSNMARNGEELFYGAFYRESDELCGYHIVTIGDGYRSCNIFKSNPTFEKYQINAALVYKWVIDSEELIRNGGYIHNGTRTINHETSFQDYLEYYFGFRKAYCRLKIKYNPLCSVIIKILFPLRKTFKQMDGIGFVHMINSVLKMEEISRVTELGD